jgi:nucleoside-diphosphate-sugar epimerase
MKVLLTGANGFVGSAISEALIRHGHGVVATTRHKFAKAIPVGPIDRQTDWSFAMTGCDAVVHTAARVHQLHDDASDRLAAFRAVNVEGTLQLARQANEAGVRRLILVSSVKVLGEATAPGQSFRHGDPSAPLDPYAISKHEAEVGLNEFAASNGMQVVIVRPPLIYGPGVRANFAAMMRAVQRGLPLPLGAVTHNRRSLVALDNLVDLLITCINHPAAANQTFLVSDGEDLSTTDLLRRMGQAMGKPARLLPVPPALLRAGASLLGKGDVAQRLLGSLQVDITHTRDTLGWAPPISVDEGLWRAAAGMVLS